MTAELTNMKSRLPAMNDDAIEKVRRLESDILDLPQVEIPTSHLIHAGMYARTICIPAGVVLTGALIKLATVLIVSGDCTVYIGGETLELTGYHVIPASAGRKQAFVAHADTHLTMIFPTGAKAVEDAEAEFTNEADLLFSRNPEASNHINITGE